MPPFLLFFFGFCFVLSRAKSESLYMLQFQGKEFRTPDSFAMFEGTLVTLDQFSISFRLNMRYERPETVFISYAVSDVRDNVIRIEYTRDSLRFIIDGYIASVEYHMPIRQWHLFTFIMDLSKGDWALYIDGRLAKRMEGDEKFIEATIPGGGILILGQDQDTFGGAFQEGQSFCGELAELYFWNRIIGAQSIEHKHNMSGEVKGMVLEWSSASWNISGDTSKIEVTSSEISILSGLTTYVVVAAMTSFHNAAKLCKNIKGKMVAPTSHEETKLVFEMSKAYFNQCYDIASLYLWIGYTDEKEEGIWRDVTTGLEMPYGGTWGLFEPNGNTKENCAALYFQPHEGGIWGDYSCREIDTLCFACKFDSTVELFLKGLCFASELDTKFTMAGMQDGRPFFTGRFSTKIFFSPEKNAWVIQQLEEDGLIGILKGEILPIGTRKWEFNRSPCLRGMTKRVSFTLSACEGNKFTCDDGSCIAIEKRCDQRTNCPDRSDEDRCAVLEIPNAYRNEVPPPFVKVSEAGSSSPTLNRTPYPVNITTETLCHDLPTGNVTSDDPVEEQVTGHDPLEVFLQVDIQAVLSINTVGMDFTVDFQMTLQWSDSRLIFHNLKDKSDLNALSLEERRSIWVPLINFGYAVGNRRSYMDDDVRGYAIKVGEPMAQDLKQEDVYNGSSVVLSMTSKYDITYVCDFDLSLYPFDTQTCRMGFDMLLTAKDKARLVPKGVSFTGKKQLIECTIGDVIMTEANSNKSSFSSIEVRIEMIRESGFHLLTTYLPTSLMIIIAYLTFFFKLQNFTDRIMVSLTSLLVLSSLLTQTSETMPKTSYFKMVDIWLFSCIVTIFIVILFHTASIPVITGIDNKARDQIEFGRLARRKYLSKFQKKSCITPENILKFGKISLPITVLIFNIIYWMCAYMM